MSILKIGKEQSHVAIHHLASSQSPNWCLTRRELLRKLLRYIPGDIVAAFVALSGIIVNDPMSTPVTVYWLVFGVLVVLTPLYVCYIKTTPSGFSAAKFFPSIAAVIAFVTWVFALGGPFAISFEWYRPIYGSITLILVTLTMPVLEQLIYRAGSGPGPDNKS